MTNKIFKTESYSDSVKKYETTLLTLGKKSKGNFGDRAKFFEADDDVRADDDENSFKDQTNIKYVSWGMSFILIIFFLNKSNPKLNKNL